ncbi:MAG: hypothetical protein HWE37_19760 [Rhodobacteraceae bacterium]|nr:hypothetical protein [Paracoccaceae bacterium]
MTRRGRQMALQRLTTLFAGTAFVITLGTVSMAVSLLLVVGAAVIYLRWPCPAAPPGAQRYQWFPTVMVADVIALVLVPLLFGAPLLLTETGRAPHGSAILFWPLGALAGALLVTGWKRSVFTLSIDTDGLLLDDGLRETFLPYREIVSIEPWERDVLRLLLPIVRWLETLREPPPQGPPRLSQESRGLALQLRDGASVIIPGAAFDNGTRQIIRACVARGVPFGRSAARTVQVGSSGPDRQT